MKWCFIVWFLSSTRLVVGMPLPRGTYLALQLRNPFTSTQQELQEHTYLIERYKEPSAIRLAVNRWKLQGVIGNFDQGFSGLVVSNSGEWRILHLGDNLEGYEVVKIKLQKILLQSRFSPQEKIYQISLPLHRTHSQVRK